MTGSQISRNLQVARENAGIDQSVAAEKLGVHVQTLSKYERGVIKKVPMGVLVSATALYGETLERMTLQVIEKAQRVSRNVSRGTSAPAGPELGQRILAAITAFEREAARLGATDPELDHIAWALRNPESSRLFYLGDDGKPRSVDEQEEELGYQIDGLRVWLERRIAKRKAAIRGQTTIVEEASEPTTPSSAVERAGRARVAGVSRKDR